LSAESFSTSTLQNDQVPACKMASGGWTRFRSAVRRSFNVVVALSALIVLAIPFALIGGAIKATSPGPVFFRQIRVGRHGRLFRIYKFRTMVDKSPSERAGICLAAPSSVTRIGRFLRDTKLDELPQLLNVINGEMNLVGPRPELPEFVAEYPPRDQHIVLSVEPGLTDFASIRFRNEGLLLARQEDPLVYYHRVVMPAKLRYCRFYVRKASIELDMYLMVLTIAALGEDDLLWISSRFMRRASLPITIQKRLNGPLGHLRRNFLTRRKTTRTSRSDGEH